MAGKRENWPEGGADGHKSNRWQCFNSVSLPYLQKAELASTYWSCGTYWKLKKRLTFGLAGTSF